MQLLTCRYDVKHSDCVRTYVESGLIEVTGSALKIYMDSLMVLH